MTSRSSRQWEWQSMRLVERMLQSWRKITRKISVNWIMNDVGLCKQAACRAVTHTNTFQTHVRCCAVYCAAHILLEYSICTKDKSRRGRLSFAQREGGTDRRRGVLPSFAFAASLFYGPAEIYSPLLLFPSLLFFTRNEWVYLHIHCGAMACKKTHNKLKTPNMKALWVVSAFLLRHLRLKRLPRASEGSKGLDKALRWRWGWWRFIISMMERERKHQLRDEKRATWTRESLLGKEVPRDVNYGDGWFWVEDTTGFFAQQQQINKYIYE